MQQRASSFEYNNVVFNVHLLLGWIFFCERDSVFYVTQRRWRSSVSIRNDFSPSFTSFSQFWITIRKAYSVIFLMVMNPFNVSNKRTNPSGFSLKSFELFSTFEFNSRFDNRLLQQETSCEIRWKLPKYLSWKNYANVNKAFRGNSTLHATRPSLFEFTKLRITLLK